MRDSALRAVAEMLLERLEIVDRSNSDYVPVATVTIGHLRALCKFVLEKTK